MKTKNKKKANIDKRIEEIKDSIAVEDAKFKSWKEENVRRRHNYVPLVYNLLKVLAEKGKLTELVDKAAKITQEKIKKKIEAKKKEKEKKEKEKAANASTSASSASTSASASAASSSTSSSAASSTSTPSSTSSSNNKTNDKK